MTPGLTDEFEAVAFILHSGGEGNSAIMGRIEMKTLILVVAAVGLGTPGPARATDPDPRIARTTDPDVRVAPKAACMPPSEAREEVKSRHLLEPFAVLKSAAAQFKAEPLSAKLCRQGDEFVYEIALLHRDGRFVHVVMSAATGKFIGYKHAHETAPKTEK